MQIELSPQALVEHRRFVRAVARRLLSDEGLVEDVVQETLLRAVQRGPRPAPRGWLARVCHNLSIDRLRGETRRSRREREAARPEHVPATHELADRLERHRMVVDAVLGLEPLFREVILLRFYEDMPPRRMAEALDVPVATVKSRLRRAFEILRTRLKHSHGENWAVALVPLLALPHRSLAVAVTGGIAMKKLGGIVVILALALTGWMVVRSGRGDESLRRSTQRIETAIERAPERAEIDETDGPAVGRDSPHQPPDRENGDSPMRNGSSATEPVKVRPYRAVERNGTEDRAGLRIQVVDEAGRAVSDVEAGLTLVVDGVGKPGPQGATDAAGLVSFDDLRADHVIASHVRVGDLNRSTRLRLTDGWITEMRVEIPGGIPVGGTVRDVETGPIPHVMLTLTRQVDDWTTDRAYGHTDDDGVYAIRGVPPGTYAVGIEGGPTLSTVTVTRNGTQTTRTVRPRRIEFHERDQGELQVIEPGPVVHDIELGRLSLVGVVRDAGTGAAVPDAIVNLQSPHWAGTTTDEQGRFGLASLPPGEYKVMVKREGYVLKWEKGVVIREGETARVEFTLERGGKLSISIQDSKGNPVAGEHHVHLDPEGPGEWTTNYIADASGQIETSVVPLGPIKLSVSGRWKGGPIKVIVVAGSNRVTVPVERAEGTGTPSLRGIVRERASGKPVAGVRARIEAGRTHIVYSDDQGRFTFEDLPSGVHRISLLRDGYADQLLKTPNIQAGEVSQVEYELERAATIHLRVTDSQGRPVSGTVYFVHVGGTPPNAQGFPLELDEDGRASFARVAPGDYRLAVDQKGHGRGAVNRTIEPGENTVEIRFDD